MNVNEKVIVSKRIHDLMKIAGLLVKNNYVVQIRYEDCGNYILEYDNVRPDLASGRYVYMTQEKYENYCCSQQMEADGWN